LTAARSWIPGVLTNRLRKQNLLTLDIVLRIGLRFSECSAVVGSPPGRSVQSALEGGSVLLPLGSPLPDDSVSAKRGESGMLGGLSVPLTWGVVVPPDDYDHWAPEEPEEGVAAVDKAVEEPVPGAITAGADEEWDEWAQLNEWEGETEPRFDVPRTSGVVPRSPAAG
jgi:hypothetical protein